MSKITEKILEFMEQEAYKPITEDELSIIFNMDKKDTKIFHSILETMEKEGLIVKTRKNTYGVPEKMNLVVGKLQGHPKGYGFIIPDDENLEDAFVPAENLNGAMNNDRVIGRITRESHKDKKVEAEIIRILSRANDKVVEHLKRALILDL